MNTLAPSRPWARLGALACATVLGTSLAASVVLQRPFRVPARNVEAGVDARLDATLFRAIDQAYVDRDFDLADSLERLRATRAAAR